MKQSVVMGCALLIFFLPALSHSQDQCGTVCPVCTGELKNPQEQKGYQGIIPPGRFNWFSIYVPAGHDEEENGSTTFSVGLFNRLETGITLGLGSWDWRGKTRVLLVPEKRITPALLAGVGNLKPSGLETNGYVMLAKGAPLGSSYFLHGYLGAAKPFDGRPAEAIFGASIGFGSRIAAMSAYDGQEFHLGAAYQPFSFSNFGLMVLDVEGHPEAALMGAFSGRIPFMSSKKPEEAPSDSSKIE
ncbi:MAG TPA: hypothetical protein VNL73_09525 [Verrucomicrobiae bacterium]|nr:hypothetical protein [Verrucomicrobiae bacterium]